MIKKVLLAMCLLFALVVLPALQVGAAPADDMKQAEVWVGQALDRVKQGDLEGAGESYRQFTEAWMAKEDGVRETSREAYKDIEDAMGQVQLALAQGKPDQVEHALTALQDTLRKFIEGGYPAGPSRSAGGKATVATLVELLQQAQEQIREGQIAEAAETVDRVQMSWLDVEGLIVAKSPDIYGPMEQDMVTAKALLTKNPPDVEHARTVIERMENRLAPLSGTTSYTFFDAALILLREGLEAMLVVVALLAFLRRSGHPDKQAWVWTGVAGGIAVSILLAVLVQILFTSGTFGDNNALIGGWTALFAAVMLLYVSYWLHSNANIVKWQQYIREKTGRALARGSLVSLALLSFLAVFREGTETVLFYIGMAPSIGIGGLLLGLATGTGLLLILGGLMFVAGLRIPVRPFFLISSVLVFYLCYKFVGVGINHLQAAGVMPATPGTYLPSIEVLGMYPTWQTTLPQLVLLLAAAGWLIRTRINDQRLRRDVSAEH
ncbi:MAG: FTR1 family iron permease [Kyrpidia tusciae]|nr:FTR1 family protein [Kyrpidia tusciae]MBE3551934.1 FTR1 family iron permease [Kyrpidia tusciae]